MALPAAEQHQLGHWEADGAVEAFLDRAGVTWEYRTAIQLIEIDVKASLTNQARIAHRLRQDLVDQYLLAMLSGARFPALVAYQRKDGAYVLMGGNHRLAAAKAAKIRTIDAYLVKTNDLAVIHLLTTTLNGLNGWRPDTAEVVEQAMVWVKQFGRTVKAAATEYGLSEHALASELRARAVRDRLGRRAAPNLARTSLDRLAQIDNDNTLRLTAQLIDEAKLPLANVEELVRDIRDERTEADQQQVIGQWRERDDVRRKIALARRGISEERKAAAPRTQLLSLLTRLERLAGRYPTLVLLGVTTDDEAHAIRSALQSAITRLEHLRNG